MNARFVVFLSVVTAVLGTAAWYLGARVVAWSPWAASHVHVVALALALLIGVQFLGPFLNRAANRSRALVVVQRVSYFAMGVFSCLFLYALVADIVVSLWMLVFPWPLLLVLEPFAVASLVLITIFVGSLQVLWGPRIYELDVPLARLPAEFDGFRIVQLTDMHLGPTIGRRFTEKCVAMANALRPDLLALTGDFVDGSVVQLQHAVEPLARLHASYGRYFVTGNHEYYSGVDEWIDEFRRLGARTLLNEHVVIRKGQGELVLAGVTDLSARQMYPEHASDPRRALDGAPSNAVKILLAHHPASYKAAAEAGFDLQLSGHTHGGQYFPFTLLVALTQRYYKGLYRFRDLLIYVSRGTGYWGPPLRFGVPAEITLVRLRSA